MVHAAQTLRWHGVEAVMDSNHQSLCGDDHPAVCPAQVPPLLFTKSQASQIRTSSALDTDSREILVHSQKEVRFLDVIPQGADFIPQEYYFVGDMGPLVS